METLAEALVDKQGGMSLRALARELDVATGTAEAWVKGWRTPKIEHLPRIAAFLNVEIDEVVNWLLADVSETGPPNPDPASPLSLDLGQAVSPRYVKLQTWAERPRDNRPPSITLPELAA